jgi:hypothetical protein
VTAAATLARIEAAGGRATLRPDGRVAIGNASRLPPELVEEARRCREDLATLLAAPPRPGSWLRSIARPVVQALAEGARRERDPGGWLTLIRPDGRRTMVAPHIVASLATAGLLPPLQQAQEVDASALGCPPSWSDPSSPPPGAWCTACGRFTRTGGRWWREAEEPSGWACWVCHPPPPGMAVAEMRT